MGKLWTRLYAVAGIGMQRLMPVECRPQAPQGLKTYRLWHMDSSRVSSHLLQNRFDDRRAAILTLFVATSTRYHATYMQLTRLPLEFRSL